MNLMLGLHAASLKGHIPRRSHRLYLRSNATTTLSFAREEISVWLTVLLYKLCSINRHQTGRYFFSYLKLNRDK